MTRIDQVELEIGAFSGVEVAALKFALEVLCPGTVLAETEFIYHTPHLLLYCGECENQYVADLDDLLCPSCLGVHYQVVQGRELLVRSIQGEQVDG